MNENFKFTWGDDVRVIMSAPASMRPGQIGSVCGMRELDGKNLYIVEFPAGDSMELMEEVLELLRSE